MENITEIFLIFDSSLILLLTIITAPTRVNTENRSSYQSIETKDRKFTYSEILKMTNNFERVLGKGGYGRVYYGKLDDIQVAVKMLFHSSADQDYKHFKAEVYIISHLFLFFLKLKLSF